VSFNRTVLLAMGMKIFIAASAFLVGVGFRADIAEAMHSWRFLLKFVLTGTLSVSTTGMLSNLGRPNGVSEGWGWGAALAPLMLVCAIAIELMTEPEAEWLARLVGHNSRTCLTVIPLLSVGPLLCFFAALRRGVQRAPGFAGAIAGVAASGIGATFYAANCTDDSPLFVALPGTPSGSISGRLESLTASAATWHARRIFKALSPSPCSGGPRNCWTGPPRSIGLTFSRRSCRPEHAPQATRGHCHAALGLLSDPWPNNRADEENQLRRISFPA
jgi:hypothetical protein